MLAPLYKKDVYFRLPSYVFISRATRVTSVSSWIEYAHTLVAEGIATGMDLDQTVSAIHTSGAQNVAIYNELYDFVVNGNFSNIADVLYNNLQDLSSNMPADLQGNEMYMQATLMELRNRSFRIDFYAMDRLQAWIATHIFTTSTIQGWQKPISERCGSHALIRQGRCTRCRHQTHEAVGF